MMDFGKFYVWLRASVYSSCGSNVMIVTVPWSSLI
jgi:hypothetical protein